MPKMPTPTNIRNNNPSRWISFTLLSICLLIRISNLTAFKIEYLESKSALFVSNSAHLSPRKCREEDALFGCYEKLLTIRGGANGVVVEESDEYESEDDEDDDAESEDE